MYYTIIAPIPNDLAAAIDPYRQKYDPSAQVIPAHISVVRPFHFSVSPETLHEHLTEVGETHAPIKVSLVGWDVDETAVYQLHLPLIAGRPEFISLRDDLLSGPLGPLNQQNKDYWPHIPLGRVSSVDKLGQIRQTLDGFEPQFIFRVTHLELLQREQTTDSWRSQKKIGLEATLASARRRKTPSKILKIKSRS